MVTLPLVLLRTIYLISMTERIFDEDMTRCYGITSLSEPSATKKKQKPFCFSNTSRVVTLNKIFFFLHVVELCFRTLSGRREKCHIGHIK